MKKHFFATMACSLALLLSALPVMAACGGNTDEDDDTAIVLPDQDTQFPELPEEALPDEGGQPDFPEAPE